MLQFKTKNYSVYESLCPANSVRKCVARVSNKGRLVAIFCQPAAVRLADSTREVRYATE